MLTLNWNRYSDFFSRCHSNSVDTCTWKMVLMLAVQLPWICVYNERGYVQSRHNTLIAYFATEKERQQQRMNNRLNWREKSEYKCESKTVNAECKVCVI